MRILIVKLSSIGDVVHTLPSLHALRKGLGKEAEIDWLVEEAASSILTGHPMIDNLIIVKNRGWINDRTENIKTAKYLASRRYDMVLDFQGLMKSGIWVLLSRGRRRIGFSNSRELSHVFLNEKLPAYDPDMHAVDRYLVLARHAVSAGHAVPVIDPVEFPMPDIRLQIERVKRLLKKNGITRFFAMVPHARWPTKLWGDERFVRLAALAMERFNMGTVLVGGTMDRAALEEMRAKMGAGALNLAGETDLGELAALFSLADFVVTVDSGPMHIAAAVKTPVIALFGPTTSKRTGPYAPGGAGGAGGAAGAGGAEGTEGVRHTVITKGLECSPCFKKKCPDPRCMTDIAVTDVIGAIERLVQYTGGACAR